MKGGERLAIMTKGIGGYRKELIHLHWYRILLLGRVFSVFSSIFVFCLMCYAFFSVFIKPFMLGMPIIEVIGIRSYVLQAVIFVFKSLGVSILPFVLWCLFEKGKLYLATGSGKLSSKQKA